MSEHVGLSFLFNNAGDVVVEFPDESLCVSLPVTCVGTNLYRLDAVPYLSEIAAYADIVEAVPAEDGGLRFVRVVQPSGWSTHSFILAREAIEGEAVQAVLREVLENGGYWEAIFGGLPLHLPAARLDLRSGARLGLARVMPCLTPILPDGIRKAWGHT